jgi:hypothetical protein
MFQPSGGGFKVHTIKVFFLDTLQFSITKMHQKALEKLV